LYRSHYSLWTLTHSFMDRFTGYIGHRSWTVKKQRYPTYGRRNF